MSCLWCQSEEEALEVLNRVKNQKPTPSISAESVEAMQKFFAPYNQRLYDLLNLDRALWVTNFSFLFFFFSFSVFFFFKELFFGLSFCKYFVSEKYSWPEIALSGY